ncbi:hypothetical protein SMICM304S_11919 [Streptomyces microflavus]
MLAELRPEVTGTYLDRLAEETTVNGRGMTDYDLPAAPRERTPLLVRRCLAYACACLREAREEFGDGEVKAYVSLSFADTEEGLLTSNVTGCRPKPVCWTCSRNVETAVSWAVFSSALRASR